MNADVLDDMQGDPMDGIIDDVLGITADREAIREKWRQRYIEIVREWLVWADEHRADLDPKFTQARAQLARSRATVARLDEEGRFFRGGERLNHEENEKTVAVIDALETFLDAPAQDTFDVFVEAAQFHFNDRYPNNGWKYVTGFQPFEFKWLSDMIDAREFQIAQAPLL